MEQQQLNLNNLNGENSQAPLDQTQIANSNLGFQIRPPLSEKFKSLKVKEIINTVLTEQLSGKTYNASQVEEWVKAVVENVQAAVKQLDFPRYKIIVQTVLGEHRGSGVKVGARCLWDADTDNYASDCFFNIIVWATKTLDVSKSQQQRSSIKG